MISFRCFFSRFSRRRYSFCRVLLMWLFTLIKLHQHSSTKKQNNNIEKKKQKTETRRLEAVSIAHWWKVDVLLKIIRKFDFYKNFSKKRIACVKKVVEDKIIEKICDLKLKKWLQKIVKILIRKCVKISVNQCHKVKK